MQTSIKNIFLFLNYKIFVIIAGKRCFFKIFIMEKITKKEKNVCIFEEICYNDD